LRQPCATLFESCALSWTERTKALVIAIARAYINCFKTSMSRTAILISCSEEEATKIRTRAEYDFRGVRAYVLSIVLRAVELDEKLLGQFHKLTPLPARTPS